VIETTGVRCPSCGARNTSGAGWCSLCFADLAARATPEPAAPEPVGSFEPGQPGQPGQPELRPEGQDEAVRRADEMLAELAARERPSSRWAGAAGMVASPGARVALMLVGTVLLTGLGFGALAALGALL
jgi:hypothetical protein